jgi:hypothetical protein
MTPCEICKGTGYIVVEVPVFADGGYSDVDQLIVNCHCNPAPTDDDYERACGFDPSFAQWRRDIDAPFDLPAPLLA